MEKQILHVFCEYDLPPYISYVGILRRFNAKGNAVLENGYVFKPLYIIPDEKGNELQEALRELFNEYYKEEQELHEKYKEFGKQLFGKTK